MRWDWGDEREVSVGERQGRWGKRRMRKGEAKAI